MQRSRIYSYLRDAVRPEEGNAHAVKLSYDSSSETRVRLSFSALVEMAVSTGPLDAENVISAWTRDGGK
jgi:hypothetical protein